LTSNQEKGVLGEKIVFPYRRKLLLCVRKKNIKEKTSGFFLKEAAAEGRERLVRIQSPRPISPKAKLILNERIEATKRSLIAK